MEKGFSQLPETGKGRDIWLFDLARGLRTRFTVRPGRRIIVGLVTGWQPDGFRLTPQGASGPVSEVLQRSRC